MRKVNRYAFVPTKVGESNFGPSMTLQGQEQSIEQIFRDMVLGNYSGLTGPSGEYDSDIIDQVTTEHYDLMNCIGMTLEEASMLKSSNQAFIDQFRNQAVKNGEQEQQSVTSEPIVPAVSPKLDGE